MESYNIVSLVLMIIGLFFTAASALHGIMFLLNRRQHMNKNASNDMLPRYSASTPTRDDYNLDNHTLHRTSTTIFNQIYVAPGVPYVQRGTWARINKT
ncbi:hypothetical protein EDC01DRAFT_658424 [Geopyxis carbonaria]|nr:hypothetical protein EDC01DRAFT_658424 [Geopyxis carbonaria]